MSLVIAHRGCSGEAPENTMIAFQKALEMKVDFIELDVRPSKDGKIMVIHDETLQRTTNGWGEVGGLTREEIQRLDAGSWLSARFRGERVPMLTEVLQLVKSSSCRLLIEIKEGEGLPSRFEREIVLAVQKCKMQKRVILQSFDPGAVSRIKGEDPFLAVGLLIRQLGADWIADAQAARAETLVVKSRLITQEVIQQAHLHDLRVFVWTVNKASEIKKMVRLGVDGIRTDYPDDAIRIIRNHFEISDLK
ncbi:MAG: glycerophosphodiester phosphodiesterase family protein [Acidobacteriota bacterium]